MSTLRSGQTRPLQGYDSPPSDEEEKHEYFRGLARAAHDKASRDYYNHKARDCIFNFNNNRCGEDEIDLHRLFAKEAKDLLRERIEKDIQKGRSEIHVIVGKGTHSEGGVQWLKLAVEELGRELKLPVLPGENLGRVTIPLPPPRIPQQRNSSGAPPNRVSSNDRTSSTTSPHLGLQQPQRSFSGEQPHHTFSNLRTSSTVPLHRGLQPPQRSSSREPPHHAPSNHRTSGATPPRHFGGDQFGGDQPEDSTASWVVWGMLAIGGISLARRIVKAFF